MHFLYVRSFDNVENLYIILLTNKLVNGDLPEDTMINKTAVKYDVWDIERLVQAVYQRKETEKLVIRFKNKYRYRLQLIKVPQKSEIYDCYVGYISGICLAEIYRDEGQRLIAKIRHGNFILTVCKSRYTADNSIHLFV